MYCYRKYGHNEGDEPRFTQPLMYALIDKKPTVREVYVARLVAAGQVTRRKADEHRAGAPRDARRARSKRRRKGDFHTKPEAMGGVWAPYVGGPDAARPEVSTGVPEGEAARRARRGSTAMPAGFHAHPKALKLLEQRRERASGGQPLDWGTGEHLAYASLLARRPRRSASAGRTRGAARSATATRCSSTRRRASRTRRSLGTRRTEASAASRSTTRRSQRGRRARLRVRLLRSIAPTRSSSGRRSSATSRTRAQVIIDQFITSAEDKWTRLSGLVLLLPHGYEGQGPEHSSARIERFLQLAAEDNIQVCNLTTPAQLFHVLRRQVLRPWRKPLIIFTPKIAARGTPRRSTRSTRSAEGAFQRVIPDAQRRSARR